MDINKRVVLKPDFILEKIDNEITVYHPVLTTSLYLNESGALIWELCEKKRRIAEIIEVLESAYPENSKQIAADVVTVIQQLVERDFAELSD